MNVIERIQMLKRILKEAEKIVTWQADIFADLNVHKGDPSAHHTKTGDNEVYGLLLTGADADKPAAGIVDRWYFATDTKILYRDDGTSWVEAARGETAIRLAQLAEKAHSSLTGIGANDHHTKFTIAEHDTTVRHPLGTVVPHDALASLTEKAHGSLSGVTSDQHHPQAHTLASHSTKAHTELTGVTSDQHHAKTTLFSTLTDKWTLAQAHRGADGKIMVFKGPAADPVEEDKPAGIPSGLIVMWHGLIANIPSGWVICDGNNGTPNLLGRFVEGVATALTNPGATGGATSKTTVGHTHSVPATSTDSDAHSHEVDAHNHSVSVASGGEHGHSFYTSTRASGTEGVLTSIYPATGTHGHSASSGNASPGTDSDSHSHGVYGSTSGSKKDSISDIRPKYYDIAFIMKT